MKISRSKFLNNPTILSNMFLEYFGEQLTKEEQDKFINDLANDDTFDVKVTVNGIEVPLGTMNDFLAKYLKINFNHLMDDYMDKKIQNKIYEIKDMLDNVQERIQTTISDIDLDIEDEEE